MENYQLNAGDSVVVTVTDTDDVTGAVVEQRDLSVDELEATLREVIGLPVEADWRPVLEKVVAWGTPS